MRRGHYQLVRMLRKNSEEDHYHLQEFVREMTANQGRIRAFLASMMPGSSDIGDVLQDTNVVLWKNRDRFEPSTSFIAWALTIARLEVLHHRTRMKRQRVVCLSDEVLELMNAEMTHDVDHEAYLQALEACMEKLTDQQRKLIELRYRPGFTLESHARKTGKKASALRVSLLRTREALRMCVKLSMKGHPA